MQGDAPLDRELERRLHDISSRYELACTLTHPRPDAEVLDDFLSRLARVGGAEVAVVFRDSGGEAPWTVDVGVGLGRIQRRRAALSERERAELLTDEPARVLGADELAVALPGCGLHHGILAPLRSGARLLGILILARSATGEPFGSRVIGLVGDMAARLALRVDHARMYGELANAQLATAVTQAADAIEVTDTDGRVLLVNPAWERMSGWGREDALGRQIGDLLPVLAEPKPQDGRADPVHPEIWSGRESVQRRDGTILRLDVTTTRVRSTAGNPPTIVTVRRDRTEAELAAAMLAESEERYALAARGANDGLWDWKVDTDAVYYSDRWKEMLGYQPNDLASSRQAWLDLAHPADRDRIEDAFQAHLRGDVAHFAVEHRMQHRSGDWLWVLARGLAFRDADGRVVRMAGSQTDISARKGSESQLRYLADHDPLTGLPNRKVFSARLQAAIDTGRAVGCPSWAVLFIDLDRFKNVNDSLGHAVGDALLVEVAHRLRMSLRDNDVAARLGGDEFGVLLAHVDRDGAVGVATRILRALGKPVHADGHDIFTGGSVGIAVGAATYEEAGEALRDADIAMYSAKSGGRGRFDVFDESLRTRAVALQQLESDLHRALEHDSFFFQYQPIVDLATHQVAGCEALLRLRHPTRGVISPAEFIPVAEENGLIHTIWRRMLPRACAAARRWQAIAPGTYVSVNVSPGQFGEADLVDVVERELANAALAPTLLKLEITENALMRDTDRSSATLQRLRADGVRVSLDDFGTGFSSLSMLHRFPVQTLKIDRSFVTPLETRPAEAAPLVRSIIALAANLGIEEVVAEGIETLRQADMLERFGCSHGQGYLFARPLDEEDVDDILPGLHPLTVVSPSLIVTHRSAAMRASG